MQFAYARPAVEKQRVGQAPAHVSEAIPHVFLPRIIVY